MNLRTDFQVLLWVQSSEGAGCNAEDLLTLLADYPVQAIHETSGPGIRWSVSFGERAWQISDDPDTFVDFTRPGRHASPLDGKWRRYPDLGELLTAAVGRKILATFPDAGLHCELLAAGYWSVSGFEESYRRVQVGRIIVAPPWQFPEPGDADVILTVQPSTGFGTGHHPSTRLALALLQQVDAAGCEVLDVGTGSGLLAIAASRLGAGRVCAIDRDPDAIAAARENLRRNPLARVDLQHADISTDHMGEFDLVLANLDRADPGLGGHVVDSRAAERTVAGVRVSDRGKRRGAGRALATGASGSARGWLDRRSIRSRGARPLARSRFTTTLRLGGRYHRQGRVVASASCSTATRPAVDAARGQAPGASATSARVRAACST